MNEIQVLQKLHADLLRKAAKVADLISDLTDEGQTQMFVPPRSNGAYHSPPPPKAKRRGRRPNPNAVDSQEKREEARRKMLGTVTSILRTHGKPMTALDIYSEMNSRGYDFGDAELPRVSLGLFLKNASLRGELKLLDFKQKIYGLTN
jgi:hypothetical protein